MGWKEGAVNIWYIHSVTLGMEERGTGLAEVRTVDWDHLVIRSAPGNGGKGGRVKYIRLAMALGIPVKVLCSKWCSRRYSTGSPARWLASLLSALFSVQVKAALDRLPSAALGIRACRAGRDG